MKKLIDVAAVTNTHGLKGEIKIIPRTDYNEFFEQIPGVYLEDETYYKITNVKYQKNNVILKLKGINTIDEAMKLKNKVLYTLREYFDSLPEGTYLICDIIGLEVKDDEKSYGIIKDVFSTGSNDVYVVEKDGEKDLLIPALKDVIKEVNIKKGYMMVKLPEGLVD